MLQSANDRRRSSNDSDKAPTPRAIDAASPSGDSESSSEAETYDEWVQNMRTIEFLRKYVRERLHRHEYETERHRGDPMVIDSDKQGSRKPLYPVLPPMA
jgi:hypothetical protein